MTTPQLLAVGLAVVLLPLAGTASALEVNRLRAEYLDDPIGIDEPRPRLSWELASGKRGDGQSAYQIVVASTPEKLKAGEGDLWDSGKVESPETAHIAYAGKPLASRQPAYWTVKVWDREGKAFQPEKPASWEMGLLRAEDWAPAKWIGPAPGQLVAPAPMLRRAFDLTGSVRRARVSVCGLGYYELRLNGRKVGDHLLDPGYTNFDRRILYVTYDVTGQLARGANVMGVTLGTGWYNTHTKAVWNFHDASWRSAPKLLLRLDVEYADGRTASVVSDERWKLSTGPIVVDSIYGGEFYDARLERDGWDSPGYDDSGWPAAHVVAAPKGTLVAQAMPLIRVTQTLKPKSVTEPRPGVFVVDFGQNFAGVPEVTVTGPAGATVSMRGGERLRDDGTLETSQIDVYVKQRGAEQPFQEARYTLRGTGKPEVYSPRFTYFGFQYLEVTGFPGRPTADNFRGLVVHTDVEPRGTFACSNDLLNRIWETSRWSYLSNLHSIPTDCPTREKNGWTGDAHLAAEMGIYAFDAASVYAKWMDDFADAQRDAGDLPGIIPSAGWGYGKDIGPAWDTAYFHIPWYLYQYYGDTRVLAAHYDRMARYLAYLTANAKDHIIGFGLGDWAPYEAQTPNDLTGTAYYYRNALILSETAKILGKSDDARTYADLAAGIKAAFNGKFFDPARRTYANGTQTALSCALYQGLVPDEHRQAVFDNLVAAIHARNDHLDCGILGTKYVPNVLLDFGRADLAYKIASQKDLPSWGYWIVEKGATTMYESWKDVDSRNHIMFGDISAWFFRALAGIRPDPEAPGFRHVLIEPNVVGDLTHVAATYHSIRGPVTSEWTLKGDTLELNVSIPANVSATVRVPSSMPDGVTEAGGAKPVQADGQVARFDVQSGTYRFKAPQRSRK